MKASAATPCQLCGAPGYQIVVPLDVDVAFGLGVGVGDSKPGPMPRASTCAEHEPLVRLRAERIHSPKAHARKSS
jgi:hypothetical protein